MEQQFSRERGLTGYLPSLCLEVDLVNIILRLIITSFSEQVHFSVDQSLIVGKLVLVFQYLGIVVFNECFILIGCLSECIPTESCFINEKVSDALSHAHGSLWVINIFINLQVRVKLDALNAEGNCKEGEMRPFHYCHVFLILSTLIVIECSDRDKSVCKITFSEEFL